MKNVLLLSYITLKGGVRDRTLFGIFILAISLILSIPLLSSFSMRQVAVVACDFSLSITSFIGLLLTIFVGNNLIAKDIDRRSIYTVISLPIKRTEYLLGKFIGLILLLFISIVILSIFSFIAVYATGIIFPQEINFTISWLNFIIANFFIFLKLTIIASVVFLFSTLATSSFLPMALSIIFYFVSESVEEVKAFIETTTGKEKTSTLVIYIAKLAFYIFPNFEAFNFKQHTIYSLSIDYLNLFYLASYSVIYTSIIIIIAILSFQKREFI
jgi:ABC-type transport system involved in multi-copper enzyme maturation permease subunit